MLDKMKDTASNAYECVTEWAEEHPRTVRRAAHNVLVITACAASCLWGCLFTRHTYTTYLQGMTDALHAVADFEKKD